MKKIVALSLVALFAISSGVIAAEATIAVYDGKNMIAAPLVPFDPAPASVFIDSNGVPLMLNDLSRWDSGLQGYVSYDELFPEDSGFGKILLGEGYWLGHTACTVKYQGIEDGVPSTPGDSSTMTDMWISIPFTGKTMIGHPFAHPVSLVNCKVTDGTKTLTWDEASGVLESWIDGVVTTWSPQLQGYIEVGSDEILFEYSQLEPGRAYWVSSMKDNLALIIPAN